MDVPCTPRALVAAGAYLGGMDLALDGFDHPGAHREHLWDIQVCVSVSVREGGRESRRVGFCLACNHQHSYRMIIII